MKNAKNKLIAVLLLFCWLMGPCLAVVEETKYPDYAFEFLGEDRYENYNRKMFNFNQKLNKYFIRPVHVVWASIMPQYGMDRIYGISNNIEYPIRFVSCLVQGDFKAALHESERFLINSTIGLAGMFDPARHLIKIEQVNEDMEQALAKCHVKAKRYFVAPVISFTTYRGLAGKLLDAALNPSTYIGSPVIAIIKAGLTINKTSYLQALLKMLEASYADPYEVQKTLYGINGYTKQNNFDRVDVISEMLPEKTVKVKKVKKRKIRETRLEVSAGISGEALDGSLTEYRYEEVPVEETVVVQPKQVVYKTKKTQSKNEIYIEPNIALDGYNPQNSFTDSMRTSLFYLPDAEKSVWNELSIWNKSFKKKIKLSEITLTEGKQKYKYRYLMQKNKQAPLAVIFPSIGEGVMSNHPTMFAKIFYDAGYSILILGNPFQWEFVESMPDDFRPGVPSNDAKMVRMATGKIIENLEKKYHTKFNNKVVMGTSYGGMTTLYMAEQESKDNTLGNAQFIAICPPVDLNYAMNQVDGNYINWQYSPEKFKELVASIAGKAIKLYQYKKDMKFQVNHMPFTEEESKLLTGFIMHQKLSDIVFVIEKAPKNKKSDIYEKTNNMGYKEYSEQYLFSSKEEANKMMKDVKLTAISDYLKKGKNYKIYHSSNDYLTNKAQLKHLKQLTGDNLVVLDNGAHLGFLYRPEFMESLYDTIMLMKSAEK